MPIGYLFLVASLLGFAGVVVILAGQAQAEMGREALLGSLSILASAGLYGWNIILMRQQAQVAGPVEIAFFTALIMTLCFAAAAPFLAEPPPADQLPAIVGAAALAFGSLILLSWAYARAEAQRLAPVEYTGFLWAAIFGWLVFAEPIQPLTLAGAAMIVVACWFATRPGSRPMHSGLPRAGIRSTFAGSPGSAGRSISARRFPPCPSAMSGLHRAPMAAGSISDLARTPGRRP